MIGSRNKSSLQEWKDKNKVNVNIGDFQKVAIFGNMVVLTVKGTAAEELVKKLSASLVGKTVIDTTNPIAEASSLHALVYSGVYKK